MENELKQLIIDALDLEDISVDDIDSHERCLMMVWVWIQSMLLN